MAEKPKPIVISPELRADLLAQVAAAGKAQAAKFVTPKEARGDTGRVPSVDAVPLLGDKTAKKMQDAWIRRMMSDCEGKPELADTLRKLSGLLRADADDATLQLLEQTIQKQSKADVVDAPTSSGMGPIHRSVVVRPTEDATGVGGGKTGRRRKVTFTEILDTSVSPDDAKAKEETQKRLEEFRAGISDGESFVLKSPGGSRLNFTRQGDSFVDRKGATATGTLLSRLEKGWTREKSADVSVAVPVSIERGKELELPEIGVEVRYKVDGEEGEIRIIRVGDDLYEATFASGDMLQQNAETFRAIAQNENWVLVSITPIKSGKPGEEKTRADEPGIIEGASAAALAAGGALAIEKNEGTSGVSDPVAAVESPEKSSIEELKAKVAEERFAYVTTDCKQDTAFKKLKRFFGRSIGEERGDPDTQDVRERYNLALTNLKEAELEQLKQSGLKGEDLKKEMVRLLNFFALEERVNLKSDRITVEAEQKKWQGGVMGKFEDLGKWYNGLSPKKKLIAGALGLGLGGVALTTGGTAVGAAAAGMLLFKQLVTTAGAKVALDGLLEQGEELAEKYFEEKKKKKRLGELDALNTPLFVPGIATLAGGTEKNEQGISSEALGKLNSLISQDIAFSDQRMQKQKRNQLWRRTATLGVAIAASSYFAYRAGVNIFGGNDSGVPGMKEKQDEFLRSRRGVPVASAPEVAASAPAGVASAPSGVASQAMGSGMGAKPDVPSQLEALSQSQSAVSSAPAPHENILLRGGGLLKDHVVTAADGKRGLWGVLQHRLPADMPRADQNRIVASIENLMRKDLAEMTPEQRAAAGFPKGDLDKIYAGKTVIHFDQFKSLTPERMQAILDGQSVGAPSGVAVETAQMNPANQGAFENKIAALTHQPDMSRDPLAAARAVDVANYDKMGNVREYLSTYPEKIPDFRVSLGHFREEIFLTGDVQKIMDQDYNKYLSLTSPELGKLHVSQITRDYLALKENPFASYDRVRNPLHFSQMQQIDRLLTASGEAYGAIGNQVPVGATIDDLTKRLTTLGYQYQTGIPGFLKIKP